MGNEITEKLLLLVNNTLKRTDHTFTAQDLDKDLFGRELRLLARDIMVLFCEVEKSFNIKIKEEMFSRYGFRTLRNIAKILEESLV